MLLIEQTIPANIMTTRQQRLSFRTSSSALLNILKVIEM